MGTFGGDMPGIVQDRVVIRPCRHTQPRDTVSQTGGRYHDCAGGTCSFTEAAALRYSRERAVSAHT